MNKFVKSILALGVTSALGISAVNAATYQVIDKGNVDSLKYTYSQQENNNGEAAISGTGLYNFPVQFQYFDEADFDAIVADAESNHENLFALSDIEDETALRAGNPTANDLSWVIRYLKGKDSSSLYQKVGDVFAMTNFNGQTELFNVFDEPFEGTEIYTRSTKEFISGITNEGWVYGTATAPYQPLPHVNSDDEALTYWLRNFTARGFFSSDGGASIIEIVPPSETDLPEEQRFGGQSAIFDISESHFAVGYVSTSINQSALDFINDETGGCSDPDVKANKPFEICVQEIASGMYNTEAVKWTIDEQGIVTSETLGQLVTPHVDDTREFVSIAQAINNEGVAVGYAHGWFDADETEPSANESRNLYAVVFKDGNVIELNNDHSEYFDSRTFDINDEGIAVGHVSTNLNSNVRTKFYYVDTNAETMEMVIPKDFFNGSSSTARSINENGKIVGSGEVETHTDTQNSPNPRRTHGFLYDITSETFTDLNDFLSCDSDYTIIEARAINDNDEISATALVRVPRLDSKGELMKDEQGEQLFEDVVRAVTLKPIAGEIENCSDEEDKVKRKGAGLGLSSIMLLILVGLRRRFTSSSN